MTTTHIKINDVLPSVTYTATAAQTVFSVPFEFFEETDLVVSINGTALTYDATPADATEYSVAGAGDTGGGSITLGAGATLNDRVVIYRDVPIERVTDFPLVGPFQIDSLNTDLDRIIAMIQQLERDVGRALLVSYGSTGLTIDTADAENGDILMWNEATGNFEMVQLTVGGSTVTVTYDALVTVSDTAPASPVNGQMWWKSDEGRMKIYYEDVDTNQWVDVSPVPAVVTRYTDAEARAAVSVAPSTETGTTYTLDIDDAYQYIRFTNAAGCAITVPPNSAVAFPIGTTITMRGAGAAVCSLVEGSGVSLNRVGGATGSLNFAEEGATVQIKKVATDEWDIIGGMEV